MQFQFPVRVEQAQERLLARYKRGPHDATALFSKAEDITWRQLVRWLEAQFAIVDLGMTVAEEVFMPYCVGVDGRTLYEHWRGRLLEAGTTK